jgi:hypothetical protein
MPLFPHLSWRHIRDARVGPSLHQTIVGRGEPVSSTKPIVDKRAAPPSVTRRKTLREITVRGKQCPWAKSPRQCFTAALLGRFSIGV